MSPIPENSKPAALSWWTRQKQVLREHTLVVTTGLLTTASTALLLAFWDRAHAWMHSSILAQPDRALSGLLLATAILLGWLAWLYRRLWKESLKHPPVPVVDCLTAEERKYFTCIYCTPGICAGAIIGEMSENLSGITDTAHAYDLLRELRFTWQFVHMGLDDNLEGVYGITAKGEAYAKQQGIERV